MSISDADRRFLRQAVDLAREGLEAGDEPFGSVLVSPDGEVLFTDHNRVSGGDRTRHPELAIAQWAAAHVAAEERPHCTVYTSGEHCAMCSAAHAWVGLGRIVYAGSTEQLVTWRAEVGAPPSPVQPLPISAVAPGLPIDGPVEDFADELRELHQRAARRTGGQVSTDR